jgi:hypothetical protein
VEAAGIAAASEIPQVVSPHCICVDSDIPCLRPVCADCNGISGHTFNAAPNLHPEQTRLLPRALGRHGAEGLSLADGDNPLNLGEIVCAGRALVVVIYYVMEGDCLRSGRGRRDRDALDSGRQIGLSKNGRTQELFRCQGAFWWQLCRVIAMACEKSDRPRDLDLNGAQCYKYPEKTFAFPHRSLLDLD